VTGPTVEQAITRVHHEEWARMVAGLARRFGDLNVAEEATAEAFVAAAERWPREGVPPNPGGWLATTATRKGIDWLRRESQRDAKHQAAWIMYDDTPPEPTGPVEDDRLRLVFTYRVPSADDIRERLAGVLTVVYLVFNEGYLAGEGDDPVRVDLTDEAIRLGRLLRTLLPDDGEVAGLLALMLLTDARRPARVSRTGELVTLDEQDRGAWDRTLIAEGKALVRERLDAVAAGGNPPGRYQLQAAINAVHTDALSARDTDWSTIVALYGQMVLLDPSPIVRLNRAVAVAEVDGPGVGLAEVDRLGEVLDGYHAFHAARADLLRRLGRGSESRAAYDRAIGLAGNPAERAYLTRRRDQLAG
jgi:RNA polymerase sigma-70 factor (ECF subfamily)